MNVTLVLPTRKRYNVFSKCVSSFLDKASQRDKVEFLCITDYDDPEMNKTIADFAIKNPNDVIYTFTRHRAPTTFVKSYSGLVYSIGKGKFFCLIQDENIMTTEGWDQILIEKAEEFLVDKPDRLLYAIIDDDTHTPQGGSLSSYTLESGGSCFPFLSREAVMIQGGIYPKEINFWGSDIAEWHIFVNLIENRIIDLSNLIRVEHNSGWHKHHIADEVTNDILNNSTKCRSSLFHHELHQYINKFNSEILRHKQ